MNGDRMSGDRMNTGSLDEHERYAAAVRAAVHGDGGVSDAALRSAAASRAAAGEGEPVPDPYDTVVTQIATASYEVTDAQVEAVRKAAGSDKAAFELIMAASIGAGLQRWEAASAVIRQALGESGDATA